MSDVSRPTSIVFVGDSICGGWGLHADRADNFAAIFSNQWGKGIRYINACCDGADASFFIENDAEVLFQSAKPILRGYINRDLKTGDSPVIFIELGGNDVLSGPSEFIGNDVEYRELLKTGNLSLSKAKEKKWNTANAKPDEVKNFFQRQIKDMGLTSEKAKSMDDDQLFHYFKEHFLEAYSKSSCEGEYQVFCRTMDYYFEKRYEILLKGISTMYPNAKFVLIGVPYIVDDDAKFFAIIANRFNNILKKITARTQNANFVSLDPMLMALKGGQYVWNGKKYSTEDVFQDDGIHPNETGHSILADYLLRNMPKLDK